MSKLNKLTQKQLKLMEDVRDEWLAKLFKTRKTIDHEAAREGVNWLYEFAGLKKPKVIFVNSPLAAQYAVSFMQQRMHEQVREQVWAQMDEQIDEQVWEQVSSQVGGQVREQVWAQVSGQVYGQVDEQVRGQVWAQVRMSKEISSWWVEGGYGNISDFGWVSFYDFFERIGVINNPNFTSFKNLINSGVYSMIQLDGLCVVYGMPQILDRDAEHRLHSENRAAISWADGYEQYYLKGVSFDKQLWNDVVNRSLSFEDVMAIENIEQRRVALEYMEPDKLLAGAQAKVIDTGIKQTVKILRTDWSKVEKVNNGFDYDTFIKNTKEQLVVIQNVLYEVKLQDWSQSYKCLRYQDPSTGRVYLSWVEGNAKDADLAMAIRHNMTKEQYLNMTAQA